MPKESERVRNDKVKRRRIWTDGEQMVTDQLIDLTEKRGMVMASDPNVHPATGSVLENGGKETKNSLQIPLAASLMG